MWEREAGLLRAAIADFGLRRGLEQMEQYGAYDKWDIDVVGISMLDRIFMDHWSDSEHPDELYSDLAHIIFSIGFSGLLNVIDLLDNENNDFEKKVDAALKRLLYPNSLAHTPDIDRAIDVSAAHSIWVAFNTAYKNGYTGKGQSIRGNLIDAIGDEREIKREYENIINKIKRLDLEFLERMRDKITEFDMRYFILMEIKRRTGDAWHKSKT